MEIIALCGIYIAELLCNSLSFLLLFHEKIRIKPVVAFGMLMPVAIGLMPVGIPEKNSLVTIISAVTTFLLLCGRWVEKGAKLSVVILFVIVMNDIFLPISQRVITDTFWKNETLVWQYFLEKLLTAFFFLCVYDVSGYFKIQKQNKIHAVIYYIIAALGILMMFCLTLLNHVKVFWKNARFYAVCSGLNVGVHVGIFFLLLFVVYIKNTNERMADLLNSEKLLKKAQLGYYRQMLQKEEDTKKYRHDMMNHLIYLNTKMSGGDMVEAKKYLGELLGDFQKIRTASYEVGNEMVDAIMNYHLGQLSDNTEVIIEGNCPVEFDMPETDVCTVFSNLFENIVEEFAGYYGGCAKVYLKITHGRDYVLFELKNTVVSGNLQRDRRSGLPMTDKKNVSEHGIGLGNVRQAVESAHGKFSWSIKEGFFCIELILPVKK